MWIIVSTKETQCHIIPHQLLSYMSYALKELEQEQNRHLHDVRVLHAIIHGYGPRNLG